MKNMDMKRMFHLLLLFLPLTVVAQQNYIPYYQTVAKAEVCVSQRRYDTAMSLYKSALPSVEYPHNKDIRNAYVCAAILNDTNFLFDTLSPYFGRISVSAFSKLPLFSKYDSLPKWNRVKVLSDSVLLISEQSINWEYVRLIDSLCKEDQKPRNKRLPWKIHNVRKREEAYRYWRFIDSSVAATMDSLILLYGYPCMQNTGYRFRNGYSYPVCLWHRGDTLFAKTEYEALCQGKISPENYARHISYIIMASNADSLIKKKDVFCTNYMPYPEDSANKMRIDSNRRRIGLPSLDEAQAMREYLRSNENPGFIFDVSFWVSPKRKRFAVSLFHFAQ